MRILLMMTNPKAKDEKSIDRVNHNPKPLTFGLLVSNLPFLYLRKDFRSWMQPTGK